MRNQLISIGLVTAVAQCAAFVKLWVVARYFGVGAELDGYNLAFILPTLISGMISGALQTGLFPVHAQMRVQRGVDSTRELERALFWCLVCIGAVIAVALLSTSLYLGELIAREASPGARAATIYVLRFAAFTVLLNAIGDYLGFILALRERFVVAAAAPIANAAVGAALLAAWPEGGLSNLALGTLLGIFVQVVIVLSGARAAEFFPFGAIPRWQSIRSEMREIGYLGAWILPGVAFSNVSNVLPVLLVVGFGEGAVSAFGYAFRLHQSALQLIVMAVSPVILARFSELVASRDWPTLHRLQSKMLWLSLAIGSAVLITVAFVGEFLLLLVFGHGRFDEVAAQWVARHWLWLSCGLGVALYGNTLAKRIQAGKGAKALTAMAGVGMVSMVVFVLLSRSVLGDSSVSIGLSVSAAISTLLMVVLLRSRSYLRLEGRLAPQLPVVSTRGVRDEVGD